MKKYGDRLVETISNESGTLKMISGMINALNEEIKRVEGLRQEYRLRGKEGMCGYTLLGVALDDARDAKSKGGMRDVEQAITDLRAINEKQG